MASGVASPTVVRLPPPATVEQVSKLARYQLREYLRSRRFLALLGIVLAVGAIITVLVAHFRGTIISTDTAFYGSFWGGGYNLVVVLAAVFFGGDAIAGEFQNKTGYFLMGLPLRRSTVYVGKYLAAFLASLAMLLVYFVILLGNGAVYFGTGVFPWQLGVSLALGILYLGAVLGATFLFSSLFKTSAYGFVLTAILFLFGFSLIEDLLTGLVHIEPWMVISYASSTVSNVLSPNVDWGFVGTTTSTSVGRIVTVTYTAGVAEGIVIMIGYLVLTALAGLALFEREEFT